MKKLGFTLAEVLITLVIIGVIAALTIPTLMNNTNGEQYRTALKKAISGVNQALTLHYALNGVSAQDYTSNADLVSNVFKKRMNTINGVSTFTSDGCTDGAVFTTQDGIIFCVDKSFTSSNSDDANSRCDAANVNPCSNGNDANLWIDVNGLKKPNQPTTSASRPKDIYQAMIYSQKVVPWNAPTQDVMFEGGTEDAVNVERPS